MEGESGEQVGGLDNLDNSRQEPEAITATRGELESVTSSAGCFMQGWRNETGS